MPAVKPAGPEPMITTSYIMELVNQLVEFSHQHFFRLYPDKLLHDCSPFKNHNRRNTHNAKLLGHLWVFIHIHFPNLHFTFHGMRHFLDNGSLHLAWTAPDRPK